MAYGESNSHVTTYLCLCQTSPFTIWDFWNCVNEATTSALKNSGANWNLG